MSDGSGDTTWGGLEYFYTQHYRAFDPPKPDLDDDPTRKERLRVRSALLNLGDQLYPRIFGSKMDLHRHHQEEHVVSSYHFITLDDGTQVVNQINSMWYHYGKSLDQLTAIERINGGRVSYRDKDLPQRAFYLHTRLQIYINNELIRVWLVLATDKNYYDRKIFKERIVREKGFKNVVWEALQNIMDKEYFYEVNGKKLYLVKTLTREEFFKFVLSDRDGFYSGIAKEYWPNDHRIRRDCIVDEMWEGFKDLYPLYDLMAYRLNPAPKPMQVTSSSYDGLFGGLGRVTSVKGKKP